MSRTLLNVRATDRRPNADFSQISLGVVVGVGTSSAVKATTVAGMVTIAMWGLLVASALSAFIRFSERAEREAADCRSLEDVRVRHSWITVCFGLALSSAVVAIAFPSLHADARFALWITAAVASAFGVVQLNRRSWTRQQ